MRGCIAQGCPLDVSGSTPYIYATLKDNYAKRGPAAHSPRTRAARLAAIRRIVSEIAVNSQVQLTDVLRREGYPVTQATLSRDLKRLGIGKAPSADGAYTYIPSDGEVKPGTDATYVQDFLRGFVSLEFSGSLGLMRTLPGHANSVALALDSLHVREVLGTVAGDDTILIVPRNGVNPSRLARAIEARVPGFPGGS